MNRVGPSVIFFPPRGGWWEKKISTPLPFFFGSLRVTCHKEVASPRRSRLAKKKSGVLADQPRDGEGERRSVVAMLAIDGRTRIASSRRPTRGSRVDIRVAPRPTAHAHARARVAPNSSLVPLKVAARARERCAAPGLGLGLRVRVRARARAGWLGLGLGLGLGHEHERREHRTEGVD